MVSDLNAGGDPPGSKHRDAARVDFRFFAFISAAGELPHLNALNSDVL